MEATRDNGWAWAETPDKEILDMTRKGIILAGGSAVEIGDEAAREGVWDLRRSGLEKVKSGLTSLEEVNSVTTE